MTRRRIFKEDAWSSLQPLQKGLVLGVGIGVVFWAFTGTLSWLAVGVFVGFGIGHHVGRRRARTQRPAPTPPLRLPTTPPPRHTPTPRVLTEQERQSSLHASAHFQGLRLVAGKQNRAESLTQIQKTIGGFPPERYEAELDDALAGIEKEQVKVRARRAEFVAEARAMDPLNAVFSIYYFNSRHSTHPQEAGLGSIKLDEALGDLYTHEQIEAAKDRSSALIEEGWTCAYYPDDNGRQVQQLREHHPGFTDTHLHKAADWGYFMNR